MIPALTTNTIKNKALNLLSNLSRSSDSTASMLVKDISANSAIVYTYAKETGKEDAIEKSIEEFGTGAAWLFSLPIIKKIFNITIYKKLGLDENLDTRLIINKTSQNKIEKSNNPIISFLKDKLLSDGIDSKTTLKLQENIKNQNIDKSSPLFHQQEVLKTLDEVNIPFKNFISKIPFFKDKLSNLNLTNAQLYKGLFVSKFVTATALSGLLLTGIIILKRNISKKRIDDEHKKKTSSYFLLNKSLNQNNLKINFQNKLKDNNNSINFKGNIINAFMHNPVLNTLLLDGIITADRIILYEEGEKNEAVSKEAFQLGTIYLLPLILQKVSNKIGNVLKMPINLDPKVLFEENLANKLKKAVDEINNIENNKNLNLVEQIYALKTDNPLIQLLSKNNIIKIVKNGDNEAISYFKAINETEVKNCFEEFKKLNKNISNLTGSKILKVASIAINILAGIVVMGRIQPKFNLWMREKLHGSKRNAALEKYESKLA